MIKFKLKTIIISFLVLLLIAVAAYYYYLFEYKVIYEAQPNSKEKKVAITFDDGPDPRFTPTALNLLKKYNGKATFFVVGQAVEKNPEIIKQMLKQGNELGDHTYSHPDLLIESKPQIHKEIHDGKSIIERITGKNVKWFRPPKMLYGPETSYIVHMEGMEMVLWQICVENSKAKTPQAMADRVAKKVKPGWIILIHDGRLDRTKSMKALAILMAKLSKEGYHFVTVSDLLGQFQ